MGIKIRRLEFRDWELGFSIEIWDGVLGLNIGIGIGSRIWDWNWGLSLEIGKYD